MRQILVLLNPHAGMRQGIHELGGILDAFCKAGFEPIVRTTQAQGDGISIVESYAGQVDRIAVIGGDGTFNEAVSGAIRSGRDPLLGYIPTGSTNDFAASLGLSRVPMQAAQTVISGSERRFDIGCFGERYFSYIASFGAFTQVSYATDQNLKNALGHLAYVLGGVSSLPTIRGLRAAVTTDSGEFIEGEFLLGAVCNSTSVGGMLTLDRNLVDFCDGCFELLLVKNPTDAIELGECIRALLAQDYRSPMLIFRQITGLTVTLDSGIDWTLDGEYAKGSGEIRISVLPKALRLLVMP